MIEDKDYIMRLTHEVVRTLIRLLFQIIERNLGCIP